MLSIAGTARSPYVRMTEDTEHTPTLERTEDGSHTLYSPRFSQHYHNPNGAVSESKHVFFQSSGLLDALQSREKLSVLEVGFGTGLNLALMADAVGGAGNDNRNGSGNGNGNGNGIHVTYHSIEAYPVDAGLARRFNYGRFLDHPEVVDEIVELFGALEPGMNTFRLAGGSIDVNLFYGLFGDYRPGGFRADFLFHDPFSPDVNPDLWTAEVFEKLMECSTPGAVLATYCAASKARGAMASAGWHVARARGALGKREMTVASPDPGKLAGLERVNEERLARRYREDDF